MGPSLKPLAAAVLFALAEVRYGRAVARDLVIQFHERTGLVLVTPMGVHV